MQDLRLFVIVFISGAAVLALEILGTRILGPFYGVSLFLWSALITVTLAALSVGYAIGGHLADRGPAYPRLGTFLVSAGVWVLLVPFLTRWVLQAAEPLGLRAAVLLTATLLFAPPLTLLGMVSPYAIRLKASSLGGVGRTAGNLYAVSTAASVLSALAVGFFLIPSVGVVRLTVGIGLSLLVASLLAFLGPRGSRVGVAAAIALLAAGGAGQAVYPHEGPDPDRGLLDVRHSPYAEIRVVDVNGARHLLIDGGIHTIVDPATWRSWHRYAAAADVPKLMFDEPGRLLLIGLGGGSVAKSYAADGWEVEAVEIDEEVTFVAREWFGLTAEDCRVHHRDGRRFLQETPNRYDLIIVDAFGSSSIPFHLATLECFALMASRLAPGGMVAVNVESEGWHDPLVTSLVATLDPSFEHLTVLPTSEPPDALGNLILIGSFRPLEFDEYAKLQRPYTLLEFPHEHWWAVQMNHAWDNRFSPDLEGAVVFTDDRNPCDLWSERVNRAARGNLHEYFRKSAVGW